MARPPWSRGQEVPCTCRRVAWLEPSTTTSCHLFLQPTANHVATIAKAASAYLCSRGRPVNPTRGSHATPPPPCYPSHATPPMLPEAPSYTRLPCAGILTPTRSLPAPARRTRHRPHLSATAQVASSRGPGTCRRVVRLEPRPQRPQVRVVAALGHPRPRAHLHRHVARGGVSQRLHAHRRHVGTVDAGGAPRVALGCVREGPSTTRNGYMPLQLYK